MPELDDRAYYTARAAKARQSAQNASDPSIAAIHKQMAENYVKLANAANDDRHFAAAETYRA